MTTDRHSIVPGPPNEGGYRTLSPGPGETHVIRTELCSTTEPTTGGEVLLAAAHLSDLHVCDSQSPARVEFLDRFADPDSALLEYVDEVGTYRAQEILTAHVVDAMVRAVNTVSGAPMSGAPLDLAVVTGDVTDNAQANELSWYLSLLDGGVVRPDSGDHTRYEGVSDGVEFDDRFWHPDLGPGDRPREMFGFPLAPGLLDSMRHQFVAPGLAMPWLAVHGNHDQMLQGTVPATRLSNRVSTGSLKPLCLPLDWTTDAVLGLLGGLEAGDPAALLSLAQLPSRLVAADPARQPITRWEFIGAHFGAVARPTGHGFPVESLESGRAYYRWDQRAMTFLVLDTVNDNGGWQGSLDQDQFDWLLYELHSADRDERYVVIASHHPLSTLVNDRLTGRTGRRVLATEVEATLAAHRCVILWLNGHTHQTAVTPHGTWWEVSAPSLIDWPQQGRIIEVVRGPGQLRIATTMIDHFGQAPWGGAFGTVDEIAGLSRELAANDWQWRREPIESHPRSGHRDERNAVLLLEDPFA